MLVFRIILCAFCFSWCVLVFPRTERMRTYVASLAGAGLFLYLLFDLSHRLWT